MICPLCGEETEFEWRMDFSGTEWAECPRCGGLTDQEEIDAANREDLPVLVPIKRAVHMPQIPEWNSRPTRIVNGPAPNRRGKKRSKCQSS
jgi:hypothetical protein